MSADTPRVLVPVKDTATLRNTVAYAVERVVESTREAEPGSTDGADPGSTDGFVPDSTGESLPELHFVYLATWRLEDPGSERRHEEATELLDRIDVWASYDLQELGFAEESTDDERANIVQTTVLGEDEYLFSVEDYADVLVEYAETHDIETVVMDPEYSIIGRSTLHQPLDFELEERGMVLAETPIERSSRRERLVREAPVSRFLFLFGLSFLFYLVLGGFSGRFDIVTGAVSAGIVATLLSGISLDHDPSFPETPLRFLRGAVYLPVLLYEITKSNVIVASVILRPSMPIKPRLTRVRVYLGPGVPITTLANSITLTPGTLTVRARDQNLYVHCLVPWAQDGLFAGSLERWVRYVFYGKEASKLASPDERGDAEPLQGRDIEQPAVASFHENAAYANDESSNSGEGTN